MKALLSNLFFLIFIVFIFSCKDGNVANTEQAAEVETAIEEEVEEKTYAQVAEMPRFPGCEDEDLPSIEKYLCANNRLNNYIHNRLRYPKIALNNKVEGIVTAQFVVRPDGLIDDLTIHNDIGYGCGETLMEIFASMNHMNERWIPGRQGGKAVRVRLAMPIEFKIQKYD